MFLRIVSVILCGLCVLTYSFAQTQQKYELQKVRTFAGYFRGAFSSDGGLLALIDPGVLSIFNTKTGRRICTFKTPKPEEDQQFLAVEFVFGTNLIAANFSDFQPDTPSVTQQIILLDSSTCKENTRLVSEPSDDVGVYVTTSLDGSLIAGSSNVGRVWERKTGKKVYRDISPVNYRLKESVLSPDGKYLVSYVESTIPPYHDYKVLLTDLRTKTRRQISTERTWGILFSPDSKVLTLVGHSGEIGGGATIRQFSLPSFDKTLEYKSDYLGFFPDVSRDGAMIASGATSDREGAFNIIRASDGKLLARGVHYKRTFLNDLMDDMHMITQMELVKFSPDGTMILSGGEDGSVKLWKLKRR